MMLRVKQMISVLAASIFVVGMVYTLADKTFASPLVQIDYRPYVCMQSAEPLELVRKVPQIPRLPNDYMNLVEMYANQYGLPSWVLARLLHRESGGDRYAKRDNGSSIDYGLMQLNSNSLSYFERQYNDGNHIDPFDPNTAIRVAAAYLADLYADTGTLRGAVMAYNCGSHRYFSGNWPKTTVLHAEIIFRGITEEQLKAWNVD